MTLTISPETEEKIIVRARERGLTADQYAIEILERGMASADPIETTESQMTTEEFLRRGPLQPDIAAGWPGEADGNTNSKSPRTYKLPPKRPTAEQVAAELEALAGTDRPAKEYPPDFFSREVIYADHD
jgi:hypothetical protein